MHDPAIAKGDLNVEKEVCVTTGCMLVQMHVMDWAKAQREDPMLSAVLYWLNAQKKTDLKALLEEHTSIEGRPNDLAELTELCDSSGRLISALNAQGERPKIYYYL